MPEDSPKDGSSSNILQSNTTRRLLDAASENAVGFSDGKSSWADAIFTQAQSFFDEENGSAYANEEIISIGRLALQSFLQANVTGPRLDWDPEDLFYPRLGSSLVTKESLQSHLRLYLNVDGESVYRLLPYIELFAFSKHLLNLPFLEQSNDLLRWRLRANTWHQRLLSEITASLQNDIYRDIQLLREDVSAEVLIERANIHILHGQDVKARNDLERATRQRHFKYALTGRMGKRTQFQVKELSQLVVLAKTNTDFERNEDDLASNRTNGSVPSAVQLNDDTLLEGILFRSTAEQTDTLVADEDLPASLASLNPAEQPILGPLDSAILLSTASSIISTSPQDELTREQTVPYADRVITGGSSNWQVYTQALLVRSRIEGYRSRTAERGVLQLQALVDQVIADTASSNAAIEQETTNSDRDPTSTFLPRPNAAESAPAHERLRYIHVLATPPRWKLEAELADRWVSLGALRTALEIYERLQMWAEVALCWAANDREDKAKSIIRQQLYNQEDSGSPETSDSFNLEKQVLPADAPRLFCILGDLEKSETLYERAWEVSNRRYARAQRSLGKWFLAKGDFTNADRAYEQSLTINPQNQGTWFALGCVRLQLEAWQAAADAFSRAIQIDDKDAESWSNLAIALLKLSDSAGQEMASEERQKRARESFVALKQAAILKRDSFRIWQNLLSIAIKIEPPPYSDIIVAQTRLIDLLGAKEGEQCVDVAVMEALLADLIRMDQGTNSASESATNESAPRKGLEKMFIDLVQKKITPLITSSRRLWLLTAKLAIHLQKPQAALTAYEKAWRSQLNKPGWDSAVGKESRALWEDVAESTIDLIDAYESLGEQKREAGMGEGELVAKDWRFKARSAARSVLARAKDSREDEEGYELLSAKLKKLKAG